MTDPLGALSYQSYHLLSGTDDARPTAPALQSKPAGRDMLPPAPDVGASGIPLHVEHSPMPTGDILSYEAALQKLHNDPQAGAFLEDFADILSYIGGILVKNADAMRKSALRDRMAARDAARAALQEQAEKQHEAANSARTLALASFAVTIAVSSLSIAASAFMLKNSLGGLKLNENLARDLAPHEQTAKGLNLLQASSKNCEHTADIRGAIAETALKIENINRAAMAQQQKLDVNNQMIGTAKQVFEGIGTASRSLERIPQAEIEHIHADASLDAANAQYLQQLSDIKKDLSEQIANIIQQSINMYKDLQNSQAEAMRAVTKA